jgi:hypothetical protein
MGKTVPESDSEIVEVLDIETYNRCNNLPSLSSTYTKGNIPFKLREKTNYSYHNRGILTIGLVRLG